VSKRLPQGQPPIVYVEWHDHRNLASSWTDREELFRTARKLAGECVTTAGFLLQQTKKYVVIAASHAPNDDVGNALMILRSDIVTLRIVKRQRGGKWKR
jgi:hypothetical protein